MGIVRRIFYMVGMEGRTLYAVKQVLEREGVKSPSGKTRWSTQVIRDRILDDVYKPYSFEKVAELVSEEVAAKLAPRRRYGIWWYNRRRTIRKQVSKEGSEGRRYRRTVKTTEKDKNEWIAVPVPDSGVPHEWVEAARAVIKDNKKASSAGRRYWELSGGIVCCGSCGRQMVPHSVKGKNRSTRYFYYRCIKHQREGDELCTNTKSYRAEEIEGQVWEFVSGLLKDPERLRKGLEAMVEQERTGLQEEPERKRKAWLEKLQQVDYKRSNFQDMAAGGLITLDELRTKLAELEEARQTAQRELKALQSHQEYIERLESDRDVLLESYAGLVPEVLDELSSGERHQIYKMLRLKVMMRPYAPPEVNGTLGENLEFCELESSSPRRWTPTPTCFPTCRTRP